MVGYENMDLTLQYNATAWLGYAVKENTDQFLFRYVTDVFRNSDSLLGQGGQPPLADLLLSRSGDRVLETF